MKRFAILALVAQGLFACKPDVPGATCSKNSDCKSGNCERGLCIEPTCTPGCTLCMASRRQSLPWASWQVVQLKPLGPQIWCGPATCCKAIMSEWQR